jgi:hypothetical protein
MYLAQPEVEQISIRTNQDKQVYHFWKQPPREKQLEMFPAA